MDRKIRIIMLVMALGMMCAEELMILSAQDSTGSATQQTQIPNDTSKEQVSTHTPQDPLTQQTQPSNDTTGENPSTGIRIFGIHFDPTLRLDMSLSIFLMLLVFIFGSKTRSKSPPELTSEEVSKPENASEVEEYIKAVDRNPKATLVEKAIADAYMLQRGERIEEAIEKWRSIANITEGNDNRLASRGLVSVGYLCVKEGMGEDALLALNKAINLEPDFVEAYNNRGAAKNLLGKHQDAIADYDKAIRLKSDHAEAYNNRGAAKNLLGKHQDAIADYDKAIRLKPEYAGAYDSRGSTKYLLGRSQDAIADYNEAIRLKSDDVQAYYHRGQANKAVKKYEEALADYDKVIDLQPNCAEVYNHRGSLQVMLGHYRKAITDYTKAIQLIKSGEVKLNNSQENSISFTLKENTKFGEAEVYYNRGVTRARIGEYEEAFADFNEALRLKPDYAEAYNNRGQINTLLGKHEDSLTDYNEAIRLKPDYVEAYSNRGPTNLIFGKYAEALMDLNEVIHHQPNSVLAFVNRAEAKVNLNRIDEARSDFQTALELAEQQQNTDLKASIATRFQQLDNSTLQTDET